MKQDNRPVSVGDKLYHLYYGRVTVVRLFDRIVGNEVSPRIEVTVDSPEKVGISAGADPFKPKEFPAEAVGHWLFREEENCAKTDNDFAYSSALSPYVTYDIRGGGKKPFAPVNLDFLRNFHAADRKRFCDLFNKYYTIEEAEIEGVRQKTARPSKKVSEKDAVELDALYERLFSFDDADVSDREQGNKQEDDLKAETEEDAVLKERLRLFKQFKVGETELEAYYTSKNERDEEFRTYLPEKAFIQAEIELLQNAQAEASGARKDAFADFRDAGETVFAGQRIEELSERLAREAEDLSFYKSIQPSPYFGRVDYGAGSFYIGKEDITGGPVPVHSWASEYGGVYENYQAYRGDPEAKLSLRRDIRIRNAKYRYSTDVFNAAEGKDFSKNADLADAYLGLLLEDARFEKSVHDIIATIQRRQYEMTAAPVAENLLVNGCAGSGKTMVLMHRLSWLAYNDRSFRAKDTFVVSPTGLLNLETGELASLLKLNEVNRLTTAGFWNYIAEKYAEKVGAYWREIRTDVYNYRVPEAARRAIYAEPFQDEVARAAQAFASGDAARVQKFSAYYEPLLLQEYQSLLPFVQEKTLGDLLDKEKIRLADDVKVSFADAAAEIFRLIKRGPDDRGISSENIDAVLKTGEEKEHAVVLRALRGIEKKGGRVFGTHTRMMKEKSGVTTAYTKSDLYARFCNGIENILRRWGRPLTEENVAQVWEIIARANGSGLEELRGALAAYRRFRDGESGVFTGEYAAYFAASLAKERFGLTEGKYEFAVFSAANALCRLYGALTEQPYRIFVDEFQNYSAAELQLLRAAFPAGRFAFFGDFRQRIDGKGVQSVQELAPFGCKVYEIEENYRNAREITLYVNKKLGTKMLPVSVRGTAREVCAADADLTVSDGDRVAVIYKDPSSLTALLAGKPEKEINRITAGEAGLDRLKLNVLPIGLASGLEFEKVVVADSGMTDNEKYVAYTRALRDLTVIV